MIAVGVADLYHAYLTGTWSDMKAFLPMLVDRVLAANAQVVVELGVRTGVSTAALLYALETTGGRLWSCDSHAPDVPPEVAGAPGWTFVQGDDLRKVAEAPRPVDVLLIDTTHSYKHTLAELRAYVPLVRPGGVVLAHDTAKYPGVSKALDKFFGPGGWHHHAVECGMGEARV